MSIREVQHVTICICTFKVLLDIFIHVHVLYILDFVVEQPCVYREPPYGVNGACLRVVCNAMTTEPIGFD